MAIAAELEKHAGQELNHALTISKHIDYLGDYLGGMPCARPKPVKLTEKAVEMVRADLQNEKDTIRAYGERVPQCDALSEYAIAEDIGAIVRHQQEHRIDLATALGEDAPGSVAPLIDRFVYARVRANSRLTVAGSDRMLTYAAYAAKSQAMRRQ